MEIMFKEEAAVRETGLVGSSMFNGLVTTKQVGDSFYVPKKGMLLVLSTELKVSETRTLHVGQHFPVVKLEDNKPAEVVELYVGQVVKVDASGKVVFNNDLAKALRKSGEDFAGKICGNVLQITDSTQIKDRVWNEKDKVWERGTFNDKTGKWIPSEKPGDRNYPYVTRDTTAYEFTPFTTSGAIDVKACNEMLQAYYNEKYSDFVETK